MLDSIKCWGTIGTLGIVNGPMAAGSSDDFVPWLQLASLIIGSIIAFIQGRKQAK